MFMFLILSKEILEAYLKSWGALIMSGKHRKQSKPKNKPISLFVAGAVLAGAWSALAVGAWQRLRWAPQPSIQG